MADKKDKKDKIVNDITVLIEQYLDIAIIKKNHNGTAYPAIPYGNSASFIYIGDCNSPVREYADEHKIPEIIGDYKIPKGLEFGDMQTYIVLLDDAKSRDNISNQEYKNRIEGLWDLLVELNPQLKDVDVSEGRYITGDTDLKKKRASIIGVDDGYSVSDLSFFNTEMVEMMSAFNDASCKINRGVYSISDEYDELANFVADNFGVMQWRPSMETLTYIKDKLSKPPDSSLSQKPAPKPPRHGS